MSPSRGRKPFVAARPRSEVYTAVASGVAIVVVTLLLIWLMRPGPRGVPGEGGLLARQPRMAILLVLALIAIVSVVVYFLRRRHDPKIGTKAAIGLGVGGVVLLSIIGGIIWPGGVIRHWSNPTPTPETVPATTVPSVPTSSSSATTPPTTNPATPTTAATSSTVAAPTTTKGG